MELSELKIKRQLKRAKLFEVQKVVKQIRMLGKKKGTDAQLQKNQRKVARLVEVLDAIKDLNLSELAGEVRQLVLDGGSLVEYTHAVEQASAGPTDRAKQRLLSNKTFQANISSSGRSGRGSVRTTTTKLISSLQSSAQKTTTVEDRCSQPTSDSYMHTTDSDKYKEVENVVLDVSDEDIAVDIASAHSTDEEVEDELQDQEDTLSGVSVNLRDTAEREDEEEEVRESSSGESSEDVSTVPVENTRTRLRGRDKAAKRQRLSYDDDTGSRALPSRLGLESTFVGTLSTANQSRSTQRQKALSTQRQKAVKQKKNRPGQRMRQKQWEEKFGEKAQHLEEDGRKQEKKGKLIEKRIAVRKGIPKKDSTRRQTFKTSQPSPPPPLHTHHPSTQLPGQDSGSPGKQQQLHPSWEAQRRKKALETGIPQFQGQRIVFSDSDS